MGNLKLWSSQFKQENRGTSSSPGVPFFCNRLSPEMLGQGGPCDKGGSEGYVQLLCCLQMQPGALDLILPFPPPTTTLWQSAAEP